MITNTSFGECLKAYRKARDLTQDALAEQVGCATESIRKMEANRQRPSKYLAELIANKLALPPEERNAFVQLARSRPSVQLTYEQGTPSPNAVNGIPSQLTSLIGRRKEIAAVCELLRSPDVRLVTLTGPGGAGKTRLAAQVASELIHDYPDGIYFVDLTHINKSSLVAARIARALGIQETSERLLLKHIRAYLHDKHLLLVLDNFEHLLPAASHLADLLESIPGLRILITSRAVLHLYGEHEFIVPPLATPNPRHLPPCDQLAEYDAVRVFVERSQAVKADFAITEANASSIADICRKLDGLPLAIELAAAHSKLLPPAAILSHLEDRFNLLTSKASNLPERHQTMHNTIDWSYGLLNKNEQAWFRRLGIFVGGCTLEAAEAICTDSETIPMNAHHGIASLLDKSLLQRVEAKDSVNRYSMLETIRTYAYEQLTLSGESEAMHNKHLAYYLEMTQDAAPRSIGMNRWAHLEHLEEEPGNLRAATQWALEHGLGETVVQLCSALVYFWYVFGDPNEFHQWLETVLGLDMKPAARAEALGLMAYVLAFMQSDYRHAENYYEQALDLWRELGESKNVSEILCQMGILMMEQGEYGRSQDLHEESLSIREQMGDQDGVIAIRECLGVVLMRQGELARARGIFQESLNWWQKQNETLATAFAYNYLGVIAFYQHDYEQARAMHGQALSLWQAAGDTRGISAALNALGPVALYQGQIDEANSFLKQSLKLRWECQDYDGIAWNLERLAETALVQDQLVRGARLWGSAEGLRASINSPLFPIERSRYEQPFAAARTQLGESTWALAHLAGQMMPIEQAVTYALQG